MMSLWICFTTLIGAAAGGGGGGGGGGGATRNVINCCLGNASVKINGSSTSTPTSSACKTNEIVVVAPRLVFSRPPDSIRLSSNIGFSVQTRPYVFLDTACFLFAPDCSFLLQRACRPTRNHADSLKSATYGIRYAIHPRAHPCEPQNSFAICNIMFPIPSHLESVAP